ncbi:positive regulation of adiponectin secretion [Mactra antiquata]
MALSKGILTLVCILASTDISINASEQHFSSQLLNDPVFQQMVSRLNAIEKHNKAQQERIEELEAHDAFQQQRIVLLETTVEELTHQIENIEPKSLIIDDINDSTEDILTGRIGKVKTPDENTEDKGPTNRIRRRQSIEGNVSFTAILTKQLTNLGLNQNIIFDHVETNNGNAYNSHHGVFVAPVSGTYVFHVTAFTLANKEAWVKIVVNGINKADAFAHGDANHEDTGSQTLVINLNQGDDVAVQNGRANDDVFGNGNMWTTFSGFLLRSRDEGSVVG